MIESACRNKRFRKRKLKKHNRERKENCIEKEKQITLSAKNIVPVRTLLI